MRFIFSATLAVTAIVTAGLGAVIFWPIGQKVEANTLKGDVNNGAYLARASGCISCHTDYANNGTPLAGGIKFTTPFGNLYSPNITTDKKYGIGNWSIEDFDMAVKQGISPKGEAYYPAFPYEFYSNFSDQDIADLWAAFQTVPANSNPSKSHEMPFPFNQRWGLKIWRAAFLSEPKTKPIASKSDVWNKGRLLVEGATHCAACHTPRNIAGARKSNAYEFKGNNKLPGGGKAPAIDFESLQKNNWTIDNLAYALETGITPNGDSFGDSMGKLVLYNTSFLTPKDQQAIATYLLEKQETE